MTDQSRFEAVADAVGNARNRQGNFAISSPGDALAIAHAAIAANDKWLKGRGWKATPKDPTRKMTDEAWDYWKDCGIAWEIMWNEAPSPEEVDR